MAVSEDRRQLRSYIVRTPWKILATPLLRAERQSSQMSKITNDGLTRAGTGCFIAVPNPYGNSGRQRVNQFGSRLVIQHLKRFCFYYKFSVCVNDVQVLSLVVYEHYSTSNGQPGHDIQRAFVYSNAAAQVLVFISSGCNPIVYGIFNKNYRKSSDISSSWVVVGYFRCDQAN